MGMDLGPYRGIHSHACGENIYPQADGSFLSEPTPAMRRALDEIDRAMNLIPIQIFQTFNDFQTSLNPYIVIQNDTAGYTDVVNTIDFSTEYDGRYTDEFTVDGGGAITITKPGSYIITRVFHYSGTDAVSYTYVTGHDFTLPLSRCGLVANATSNQSHFASPLPLLVTEPTTITVVIGGIVGTLTLLTGEGEYGSFLMIQKV